MMLCKLALNDAEETHVAQVWAREAPRAGEYVWVTGGPAVEVRAQFGTTSFRVVDVAHWISADWSPVSHAGEPTHTVCLYVDPVLNTRG